MRDGQLINAIEEERLRRIKHWAGFPSKSVDWCLRDANLKLSDVNVIAINSDPSQALWRKARYMVLGRPSPSLILDRLKNQNKKMGVEAELQRAFADSAFKGKVVRVEHHLAHLASAFLVGPFKSSVCLSIDGFGDFASCAYGMGRGNKIEVDGKVWFPHSLGIFYQALTQYLGFPHFGDEYKVMGLAPYGQPSSLDAMRKIVRIKPDGFYELDLRYFRHHKENVSYEWQNGVPSVGTLFSAQLETLLGPARKSHEPLEQKHKDIARSVQAMYEEAFFAILSSLHRQYGCDDLVLAGGCGMNSVANGKVLRHSKFKRLYVQSAAGDAGGAIGAAMQAAANLDKLMPATAHALHGDEKLSHPVMDHAYLGWSATEVAINKTLQDRKVAIAAAKCKIATFGDERKLCKTVAAHVADGKVVGWFQGRMEWGPRALGNRSIVCDPRRADMKDILNLKIKRRESFRPFAPSVMAEHVAEWFEENGDVPFMMQVYQIIKDKRALIPAVTHVDGSGRLQSVYRTTNSRYWGLIDAFREITGVPMVLNTSFNENEPVVCKPEEALDCFLRTSMDVLVLGNSVVFRSAAVKPKLGA